MKKSLKLIILFMLMTSSLVFALRTGFLKGIILMVLSLGGVWLLESRELNRMIDYFEPLLFRCGREVYVEESLDLLQKQLVFKKYFQKRLLYLLAGLNNIRGQYDESLALIEKSYPDMGTCKDKQVLIEWQYGRLKKGQGLIIEGDVESHREKLCYALSLINGGQKDKAMDTLHQLREAETGNVIFREVNLLLSELYLDQNEEEAQYYKMIADSFYNSDNKEEAS